MKYLEEGHRSIFYGQQYGILSSMFPHKLENPFYHFSCHEIIHHDWTIESITINNRRENNSRGRIGLCAPPHIHTKKPSVKWFRYFWITDL